MTDEQLINIARSVEAIETYGNRGFIVSICYGLCGDYEHEYSVNVMDNETGREFAKPFGVSRFEDIAMVLANEVPRLRQ